MKLSLTRKILIGLALGIVAGWVTGHFHREWADVYRPFSGVFLRLIKMSIAPLIFASLVAGVAGGGHIRVVGRMAVRALIYFEVASTAAIAIGLALVNLVKPGEGIVLPPAAGGPVLAKQQGWGDFLLHAFPESVIKAMAEGDVLQIVVFSFLFAVALNLVGERGRPVVEWCEAVAQTMYRFTDLVMRFAPVGVGCAMAYVVAHGGLSVLWNLGKLVATLYAALIVFVLCVLLPIALFFKVPLRRFVAAIREPALIAFTTTSSESALPRAMEVLEKLGVPRRTVALVLPLGYSFNLDGSSLYVSLAALFVAQAAGVHLSWSQQFSMLLILMLTTKGVAAVPRASLVVLSGALVHYGLPLEGLTLILGVDELMDMGRTCINVIGNCLAAVVVAKWEGDFQLSPEAAAAPATAA